MTETRLFRILYCSIAVLTLWEALADLSRGERLEAAGRLVAAIMFSLFAVLQTRIRPWSKWLLASVFVAYVTLTIVAALHR